MQISITNLIVLNASVLFIFYIFYNKKAAFTVHSFRARETRKIKLWKHERRKITKNMIFRIKKKKTQRARKIVNMSLSENCEFSDARFHCVRMQFRMGNFAMKNVIRECDFSHFPSAFWHFDVSEYYLCREYLLNLIF